MAATTTELTFTKNINGFWESSFTASGKETFLYINRTANGALFIQSTPDEDDVRPCTDYACGSQGYADLSFRLQYPDGVTVIVTSATEIDTACYVENE